MKDQADSKLKDVTSVGASGLEGCLEISTTSGGFDENLVISFGAPILKFLETQTLNFLDKDKTPQSRHSKGSEPEASIAAGQGQPTKQN